MKTAMIKMSIVFVLAIVLMGCAANEGKHKAIPVDLTKYLDLTQPERRELADKYWLATFRVRPAFPIHAARRSLSGCVEVILGIDSTGKIDAYKVIKSYPEGMFDRSALAALREWRWSATPYNINRQPVLIVLNLGFNLTESNNRVEASKKCGYPRDSLKSKEGS